MRVCVCVCMCTRTYMHTCTCVHVYLHVYMAIREQTVRDSSLLLLCGSQDQTQAFSGNYLYPLSYLLGPYYSSYHLFCWLYSIPSTEKIPQINLLLIIINRQLDSICFSHSNRLRNISVAKLPDLNSLGSVSRMQWSELLAFETHWSRWRLNSFTYWVLKRFQLLHFYTYIQANLSSNYQANYRPKHTHTHMHTQARTHTGYHLQIFFLF